VSVVELGGTQCTSDGGSSLAEVPVGVVRMTVSAKVMDASVPGKLVSTVVVNTGNSREFVVMLLLLLL